MHRIKLGGDWSCSKGRWKRLDSSEVRIFHKNAFSLLPAGGLYIIGEEVSFNFLTSPLSLRRGLPESHLHLRMAARHASRPILTNIKLKIWICLRKSESEYIWVYLNLCIFECVWIWIYLSHRHGLTANVSQLILAEHILIRHTAPIYPFHKVHLFVWGVFVLPFYDFSFPMKLELSATTWEMEPIASLQEIHSYHGAQYSVNKTHNTLPYNNTTPYHLGRAKIRNFPHF